MIQAGEFLDAAKSAGFDFFTGVPCSFLTPVINRVISDRATRYVGAASEGEAVAIAAGAWLAGRETVVMCQNSGLGNMVNPLTSLNWPFRIPSLLLVTWRGQPGLGDEPQHELMGQIVDRLLEDIEVRHGAFPEEATALGPAMEAARAAMAETGLPYAMVLAKGAVASEGLDQPALSARPSGQGQDLRTGAEPPRRIEALERLLAVVPDEAAIIATTGKAGRELFTLADREQHLYQVGSMGCASGMGLGVALNSPKPVLVVDGDGAALMKLGSLATVGAEAPENLVHLLLDNGVHDSTGGQATVSPNVDFAAVALACGYARAWSADALEGLERALRDAFAVPGPSLIHLRIQPGSIDKLGRPTVKPPEVAQRFKAFLTGPGLTSRRTGDILPPDLGSMRWRRA